LDIFALDTANDLIATEPWPFEEKNPQGENQDLREEFLRGFVPSLRDSLPLFVRGPRAYALG